jgi:hypothetical protein
LALAVHLFELATENARQIDRAAFRLSRKIDIPNAMQAYVTAALLPS